MTPVETAGLVLTSLTIVGILLGSLGWWINTKIKEATYQIQPNTTVASPYRICIVKLIRWLMMFAC